MRNRISFLVIAFVAIIGLSGCIKPPRYDAIVTINTNELAYLVDLQGDAVETASYAPVNVKNVPIKNYWQKLGRFEHQGTWRPSSLVITVPQAPVRLKWDSSNATNTVRMTSVESSGFIVPMIINAYIETYDDGQKYLKAFKPENSAEGNDVKIWQRDIKEWTPYLKLPAQPLENALNTVVYTKFIEQANQLFIKVPILNAEIASKIFIPAIYNGMEAKELERQLSEAGVLDKNGKKIVIETSIPSLKEWAKSTYGITITAMAPEDGVLYDNKEVQVQIDNLAAGVMKEKALAQDRINAEAQQRVANINAETERQVAATQANTANARAALQKIENDKLIAQATADAIRSGNQIAPGSLPKGLTNITIISDRDGIDAFGFPTNR